MLLSELPRDVLATIVAVDAHGVSDPITERLLALGFVAGEQVRCTALAPFGADPMLVQIGYTRFALRRSEAQRIHIQLNEAHA